MFKSSSVILFDLDLRTNEISLSDAFRKNFGYIIKDEPFNPTEWIRYIHPEDRDQFVKNYSSILKTKATEWRYRFRLIRSDGSINPVISSAIILRDQQNLAYRIISSIENDVVEQSLEDDLKKQLLIKEKEFAEALEEARETERSNLGKELHDNVNQLLGVSKLYLDMARNGGSDAEMFMNRSSEYTLTAIDEIRKLTRGLTGYTIKETGLCTAIENISHDTMETNSVKIVCQLQESVDLTATDAFKVNIFRIVQEQLNNILKHASASRIVIRLLQNKKTIKLIIRDNGIGFDLNQKRKGIGLSNIEDRAKNLKGSVKFVSEPGRGCLLTASFPVDK
jgi:PAS domain S-box-containing protein